MIECEHMAATEWRGQGRGWLRRLLAAFGLTAQDGRLAAAGFLAWLLVIFGPLALLIFYQDGYFLFRRGADPQRNVALLALPAAPQIQHPQRVELGQSIAFLGYDLSPENAAPGQPVHLATYWRSLAPGDRPYLLFLAVPGAQVTADPVFGLYPVVDWRPGQIIRDERTFALPALADGSDYEIVVGLLAGQADPHLISPQQFLGGNVVRIARVNAKAGDYTFSLFPPQGAPEE